MLKNKEGRVLRPIKQSAFASESNISKISESKYDTEGDISESNTLEVIEMLKDEEFAKNWSSFSTFRLNLTHFHMAPKLFKNGIYKFGSSLHLLSHFFQIIWQIEIQKMFKISVASQFL